MEAHASTPLVQSTAHADQAFWARVIAVSEAPRTPLSVVLRAPWRWLNGTPPAAAGTSWTAAILPFRSRGRTPSDTLHTPKDDDRT